MPTLRVGECNRCGLCCIDLNRDTERATGLVQTVPGYCVFFRWQDEAARRGECIGRDSAFYLAGCHLWPTHPGQIADKPECSFEFVEVSGG